MGYLKLYLDPFGISSIVLYGEENFPQALAPDPQIFLERRTISQNLQDIAGLHVRSLNSYL
jgi:hypothetical protein